MTLKAIRMASPLNYIMRKYIAKVNGYRPLCYQPLYFGTLSNIKCASVASYQRFGAKCMFSMGWSSFCKKYACGIDHTSQKCQKYNRHDFHKYFPQTPRTYPGLYFHDSTRHSQITSPKSAEMTSILGSKCGGAQASGWRDIWL